MLIMSKSLVLQLQNLKLLKHQFILSVLLKTSQCLSVAKTFPAPRSPLGCSTRVPFCKLFCLTIKQKGFTEVKHLLSASPLIIVSFDEGYPRLSVSLLLPFICSSFSFLLDSASCVCVNIFVSSLL